MAVCVTPDSLTPVVSFSRITLETPTPSAPEELLVTVEIIIQESDTGEPLDSFLDDDFFNDHLKIRLVQSTIPSVTEFMITNQSLPTAGSGLHVRNVSIGDVLNGREESQFRTIDENGDTKYNIRYRFAANSIIVPDAEPGAQNNPEHLTYLVQSIYDVESLGGLMDLPPSMREIKGNLEFKRVFQEGNIVRTESVSESVIQDFRIIERLQSTDLDSVLSRTFDLLDRRTARLNVGPRGRDIITSEILNYIPDPGYFTNFRFSRDRTGRIDFQFELNFRDLILEKSVFSRFMRNIPEEVINRMIIPLSQIKSMQITRRRVVPLQVTAREITPDQETNRSFDPNEPDTVIAILGQDTDRGVLIESLATTPAVMGHVKTFLGSDMDAELRNAGHYEYSVEMEVQDYSVDFFAKQYQELLLLAKGDGGLAEYINLLNIPKVFNKSMMMLLEQWTDSVVPIISKHVDIMVIFGVIPERGQAEIKEMLEKITHPSKRDLRGVLALQKLVDDLLNRLKVIVETAGSSILPKDANRISTSGSSSRARRVFTIHKKFKTLINKNPLPFVGFDYISHPEDVESTTSGGPRVVDFEAMQNRLRSELTKNFTDIDLNIEIEDLQGNIFPLDLDIENAPIILSPSMVSFGGDPISFLDRGADMWDGETLDLLTSRIMDLKSTGDIYGSLFKEVPDSRLSVIRQRKDYHISNLMSAFNVTVIPENSQKQCAENQVPVKDVLPDTIFSKDLNNSKEQSVRSNLEKSGLSAEQRQKQQGLSLFAFRLFSNYTVSDGLEEKLPKNRKQRTEILDKFDFQVFNLNTPNNIFSNAKNKKEKQNILKSLPLQQKAFVLSTMGIPGTVYDLSSSPNLFSDEKKISGFVLNYLLLYKVEYLTGYKISSNGRILMKDPQWKTATLSKLRAFNQDNILCRLMKYEDSNLPSVYQQEGLSLPIYNEHFIIRKQT